MKKNIYILILGLSLTLLSACNKFYGTEYLPSVPDLDGYKVDLCYDDSKKSSVLNTSLYIRGDSSPYIWDYDITLTTSGKIVNYDYRDANSKNVFYYSLEPATKYNYTITLTNYGGDVVTSQTRSFTTPEEFRLKSLQRDGVECDKKSAHLIFSEKVSSAYWQKESTHSLNAASFGTDYHYIFENGGEYNIVATSSTTCDVEKSPISVDVQNYDADLYWCSKKVTESDITLNMNNKMAKLTFNFTPIYRDVTVTGFSIRPYNEKNEDHGIACSGAFNVTKGTWDNVTLGSVYRSGKWTASVGQSVNFSTTVIPCTIVDGGCYFVVNYDMDNQSFSTWFTISYGQIFSGGKEYVYDVNLYRSTMTVSLGQILPWDNTDGGKLYPTE